MSLYNMALTVVEHAPAVSPVPETFKPPPKVVTTPCDIWPRPYYLEDGLRKVRPYHFTYNTFCKERWRGRELLDIFICEFRDRSTEYYVCASTVCTPVKPYRCTNSVNVGRCHHPRHYRSQRPTSLSHDYRSERRCGLAYSSSPRTARDSSTNWYRARGRRHDCHQQARRGPSASCGAIQP